MLDLEYPAASSLAGGGFPHLRIYFALSLFGNPYQKSISDSFLKMMCPWLNLLFICILPTGGHL